MNFKPENLRKSDAETPSWVKIRAMDKSPLILVKSTGEVAYANSPTGKDVLIERFDEQADLLLWSWAGEWRTDVFLLSRTDLRNHYCDLDRIKQPGVRARMLERLGS
jgi:hypothetical protein